MWTSTDHRVNRSGFKGLFTVALLAGLAACSSEQQNAASTPDQPANTNVAGNVTKGATVGATVEFFLIDAAGLPIGESAASAVTDTAGNFAAPTTLANDRTYLVRACGGIFKDESDPLGLRTIALGSNQCLESVLPAGVTSVAITPYTQVLVNKVRREANGSSFASLLGSNRDIFTQAFGFDILTNLPGNPTAPTGTPAQIAYAMALGGAASAMNNMAVQLGLSQMNFAVVLAFTQDLSDGVLDGRAAGEVLMINGQPLPDTDINGRIRIHRNNLFSAFGDAPLVIIDESILSQTGTPATINAPPIGVNDTFAVPLGQTLTVDAPGVLSNDAEPDGQTLTAVLVDSTAFGDLSLQADGSFVYAPSGTSEVTDSFTYRASDGSDESNLVTVTISVTALPRISIADAQISEGNSGTTVLMLPVSMSFAAAGVTVEYATQDGTATTADADYEASSGTLTFAADGSDAVLQLEINGDTKVEGDEIFTLVLSNPQNALLDQSVASIRIINDDTRSAPVANNDNLTVPQDSDPVQIDVLANDSDPDGDTLTILNVTAPDAGGTATNADTSIQYQPATGFSGTETFTYIIGDGLGGTASATVTVTVQAPTPSGTAPVAANDNITIPEGNGLTTIDVLANDSDPNQDPLSIVSLGTPSQGGSVQHDGSQVQYEQTELGISQETFTYTISDGTETATATVTVTFASNTPPVANPDTATVAEGSTGNQLDVIANDTDADDDLLTLISVTSPSTNGGTVSISGNQAIYAAPAEFSGTDTFSYTISDGQGGSDTAIVSVTVTGSNAAPVANNDTAITNEDALVLISVLGNDTDADLDTLTIDTVTTPIKGTANIVGNQIEYSPLLNDNGTDSFDYTVSDGNGGSDSATVTVTINPVNDEPTFVRGSNPTVDEDAPAQSLTGWASSITPGPADEAAQTVNFVITNRTNAALFAVEPDISPDGTLSYTTATDANGMATFDLALMDDGGTANGGVDITATSTVTITVNPLNDAPFLVRSSPISRAINSGALPISTADFSVDDIDTPPAEVIISTDSGLDCGEISPSPFTQADLDGGLVTFNPDAGSPCAGGDNLDVILAASDGSTAVALDMMLDITASCLAPPFDGLVAWYSGDAIHSSADFETAFDLQMGNHASAGTTGAASGVNSGKVAQAMTAGSVIDVLTASALADYNLQAFTIDAWIMLRGYPPTGEVAPILKADSNSPNYQFSVTEAGLLQLEVNGDGGFTTRSVGSVPLNTWMHVAASYDDNSGFLAKFYINGQEDAVFDNGSASFIGSTSGLLIGGDPINGTASFNGDIDELDLFNRQLDATEIMAIYQAGNAGKCKPAPTSDLDFDNLQFEGEMLAGANPNNHDTDNDGYVDGDEANYANDGTPQRFDAGVDTDPTNPDTDGDNVGDGTEVESATDPLVANTVYHVYPGGPGADNANDGLSWATAFSSLAGAENAINAIVNTPTSEIYVLVHEDTLQTGNFIISRPYDLVLLGSVSPSNLLPTFPPTSAIQTFGDGAAIEVTDTASGGQIELRNMRVLDSSPGILINGGAGGSPSVVLSEMLLDSNSTSGNGGGLLAAGANVTISFTHIVGNSAGNQGGGVYVVDGSYLLSYSLISDNSALTAGGFGAGQTVVVSPSIPTPTSVRIEDSTIAANFASGDAGGVSLTNLTDNASIVNTKILSNSAGGTSANGGGLDAFGVPQLNLVNNLIVGNYSEGSGGGMRLDQSTLADPSTTTYDVRFNTLAYNQTNPFATGGQFGGGARLSIVGGPNSASFNFLDNILYFNQQGTESITDSGDNLVSDHLVGINNIIGPPDATGACTSNIVEPRNPSNTPENCPATDPLFLAGFYLDQSGPAIDAGSEAAGTPPLVGANVATNINGASDAGIVDLGFHYDDSADGPPNLVEASPAAGATICFEAIKVRPTRDGAPIGSGHVISASTTEGSLNAFVTLDPVADANQQTIFIDLGDGYYKADFSPNTGGPTTLQFYEGNNPASFASVNYVACDPSAFAR